MTPAEITDALASLARCYRLGMPRWERRFLGRILDQLLEEQGRIT